MKIIIVGATGTLGKAVSAELAKRHDIVKASLNKGDVKLDMTSFASIESMFKQVGKFDALICTAGRTFRSVRRNERRTFLYRYQK